ncbi:MAG TPA: tetratricopeptide repeat protein [Roseiflexaceae bacterium]|nr:tetratricopeptide repeat protein [Roseiflexaceae bacterium]
MDESVSFGAWLRRRRKALDLTQEALGQLAGCTTAAIKKIEADARRPSRELAARLADCLALPAGERGAFMRAARAELAPDRLPPPAESAPSPAIPAAAPTTDDQRIPPPIPALRTSAQHSALPSGTLTFLFTDIAGSTQLWERHPAWMRAALARHDALLRQAIESHGGQVFKSVGDGVYAVFADAPTALAAALAAQRALAAEPWDALAADDAPPPSDDGVHTAANPDTADTARATLSTIQVRMALHTGAAEARGGDYFGPALNRLARLLACAHGGQVLATLATAELLRDQLPPGVALRDLGLHRLRDVSRPEQVFQATAQDLPADFPPLRALEAPRHNLPTPPTSFVGRERELAELDTLLRRAGVRLLTLTGPGGTGKTRLALQTALALASRSTPPPEERAGSASDADGNLFADGVWFVDLAPVREAALVLPAVTRALGVREAGGRPLQETLGDYLREKRLLLVLDNLEQVVDAAPELAALLAAAPGVKALATSRALLHLAGEREYAVPPLELPPIDDGRSATTDRRRLQIGEESGMADIGRWSLVVGQSSAVRLFVERVQAVKPGFQLTQANVAVVAAICARLDGLPLAIELAAARIRLFTPEALLARLSAHSGASLQVLTGGPRDVPARQQTLRDTIAWSYGLLTPEEQALFRRLAVFVGGWTLEAAAELAACSVQRAAWPVPRSDANVQSSTFDLLSSLVDKSLVQAREGPGGEPRFTMLETIREYALERLAAGGEEAAAREAHAASFLALAEAAEPELRTARASVWLEALEAEHDNLRAALGWFAARGDQERLARAGYALWRFWFTRGHWGEGRRWLAPLLREADAPGLPPLLRARALLAAGMSLFSQSYFEQARQVFEQSLALFQEAGDQAGCADSLEGLAHALWGLSDYEAAVRYLREALAISRAIRDQFRTAWCLSILGFATFVRGDLDAARGFSEEGLALFRALGIRDKVAWALPDLGLILQTQGDYARSEEIFAEALVGASEAGDRYTISSILNYQGQGALTQGDHARAEALFAESLALRRKLGDRRGSTAVLANLSRATLARGDVARTRALIVECLALARELGYQQGFSWGLGEAAALASFQGQAEQAARLLGAAETLREASNIPIWPDDRARYEQIVAAVRAALGDEDFAAAWSAGAALTLEQAVAEALEG